MSDDLLQRAARALRDEADGHSGPGLPKQAILKKIEANRRASAQRWAVATPLVLLLVTSTAIAAATGALPGVWQKVKQLVAPAEQTVAGPSAAPPAPEAPRRAGTPATGQVRSAAEPAQPAQPATAPLPAPEVAPLAQDLAPPAEAPVPSEQARNEQAIASPPVALQHDLQVQRAGAPARKEPLRAADAATASTPAPRAEQPPAPPAAPEAAASPPAATAPPASPANPLQPFRAAQRLQFKDKNWLAALAAWDAYLLQSPRDALAPEARWNRAICLLRLERTAEARQALQPFAQGAEGGYRQAQAVDLLKEIDGGEL